MEHYVVNMKIIRHWSFGTLLATVVSLLVVACDSIPELPKVEFSDDNPIQMLVVNEGLFTTNTAAISAIYEDGTVFWDVFEPINQRPLGDVAQSITEINHNLFVAVNNSRRVEILDARTFKSVGSIRYSQSGSPRYITPITPTTALVSDLYGQIVIISTVPPYEVLEYIFLPTPNGGIEQMVTVKDKVFGAYLGKGIAIFDVDKIRVSEMRMMEGAIVPWNMSTAALLADYKDRVWVTTRTSKAGYLTAIEYDTEKVADKVEIKFVSHNPKKGDIVGMPNYNRVDITPDKKEIYVSLLVCTEDGNKDAFVQTLYKINVDTHELTPYMALPGVKMMYGMNISPKGDVCICDCLDYTAQRGYVRVYPHDGGEVKSYKVGVYPNRVFFLDQGGVK